MLLGFHLFTGFAFCLLQSGGESVLLDDVDRSKVESESFADQADGPGEDRVEIKR